jgi:copper transport outer membrane protein MctB
MIDFRYHLVSIVAIFLALAVGLLLGSTVLRPYALEGLQKVSKAEKHEIDSLLGTRGQLQRQVNADNQFVQANAAQTLRQLLEGQQVVLVLAPGAPDSVTGGVTQALGQAGAKVTGQLQLQAPFFDTSPAGSEKLAQVAEQLAAPQGLTLAGSGQAQASELIASSVMTKDGPGQPVAGQRDSNSATVINGLSTEGFLTSSGNPWDRATLAVVIIPAAPATAADSNPASQALVTLGQRLNLAGLGTVMAGSIAGSGPGSAIDVMRTSGQTPHLSSVDNADTPAGQVVVAQALFNLMHGKSGNYGVAASANAGAPSPAPSASPSASATSVATNTGARPGQSPTGKP